MNDLALQITELRKTLQRYYGRYALPMDVAYTTEFSNEVMSSIRMMNSHAMAIEREVANITEKYPALHLMA